MVKHIFQDIWFRQWFIRPEKVLHEKFIDYAWVLLNLNIEAGNILDVGCGGSFFPLLLAIQGFTVTATDSHPMDYKFTQYMFKQGEAKTVTFNDLFDRIVFISSLEHFGVQDNMDLDYDFKTIEHLSQYLKPDGQWIFTGPFGVFRHLKNWRVYDQNRLNKLFPDIVKQEYFLRKGIEPYFKKVGLDAVKNIQHGKGRPGAATTCLVANK